MPCSIGMNGCKRACLHRQLVMDYRVARHAAELQRESMDGGYSSERNDYGPIITFKDYIIALAKPPEEYINDQGASNAS